MVQCKNTWLECKHGAVRVEGDQASPPGHEHKRCTQTECLQQAAQWWEAEWWLHRKEALTERLKQAPATTEHCADCAAMGLCERQCEHTALGEPTPPDLVSDDTSSSDGDSSLSNGEQHLPMAPEPENCNRHHGVSRHHEMSTPAAGTAGSHSSEESDSSYSSAEEGDSDSSYSSAEEGCSDTEEAEEDGASWLESLHSLLANAGAEREESFKADSSSQAKRIRERRREKKRSARVKAQKAAKKAQSKLQDCVDRETLLVEEATHPPGRFSGGHTSFSTRHKPRKEGSQKLHELNSEHDAATKIGKERRKKHVPQRARAPEATEWSWTALLVMLLTLSLTASMSGENTALLPQMVSLVAVTVLFVSATATLGSRAAKNLIQAACLHKWYLPPNSVAAKVLAAIPIIEAAILHWSSTAAATTTGAWLTPMLTNAALGQCAVTSMKLLWTVYGGLLGTLGLGMWWLWLMLIGATMKRIWQHEWNSYWTQIYAAERVRARYQAAHVYLKTETPQGTIKVRYLVDLGAAASVVSRSCFMRACESMRLAPSRAKLRAASGHMIPVSGVGTLKFLLPKCKVPYEHRVEVVPEEAMPAGLQILGVDFWEGLKSGIDLPSRSIRGTTPTGEHFELPFTCAADTEQCTDIAAMIRASQSKPAEGEDHSSDIRLQHGIELQPGQVIPIQFPVPKRHRGSWWKHNSWIRALIPESSEWRSTGLLWQPSSYEVAFGSCDKGNEDDFTQLTPTSESMLAPHYSAWHECDVVTQYLYLPDDAPESVHLPPGTTIGRLERVKLCDINDDQLKAARQELAAARVQWLEQTLQEELRINSMLHEAEDPLQSKQTLTRHKALHKLKDSDVRACKTGDELVELWTKVLSEETSQIAAEFKEWFTTGAGKGLTFGDQLDDRETHRYKILCFAFRELFLDNPKAPPEIEGIEHALYFKPGDHKPHRRALPQLSRPELEHMSKDLAVMLANHIVQYSASEWATLPVFAKKKDGTLRFAIDYRALNDCIVGDSQSIPNIGEVLDSLGEAAIFSTYDCCSGFWGCKLREKDRQFTAFHGFHDGAWNLYEFCRMPFGLKAATATYQRMQQRIMGPGEGQGKDRAECLLNKIVKVFVDDGIVYSKRTVDHINDLAKVLKRLSANKLGMKPSKCTFGADRITALGHDVVAGLGIRPEQTKIEAIIAMDLPDTVDALSTFIGATGWVAKFVPEYAALVAPLREITKKYKSKSKMDIKHEWQGDDNQQAVKAFNALKLALASRPCLAFPDYNKPFILLTDANNEMIAGCLAQLDDEGNERPIAYHSTALTPAQKNYGISGKEGLAVCVFVRKFRHMLYGNTNVVVTDHSALMALCNPKKEFTNPRMARYALELSEHDLIIAHRPGKELFIPDMLTRAVRMDDEAEIERLMAVAWGNVAELIKNTEAHLHKQALSQKNQTARLKYQIDHAELRELVKGKHCTKVKEVIEAIQSGKRPPKPQTYQDDDHESRFETYYDVISGVDALTVVAKAEIVAAQEEDEYCAEMIRLLSAAPCAETRRINKQARKKSHIARLCRWAAPYYGLRDGLLCRVSSAARTRSKKQHQDSAMAVVIPDANVQLQLRISEMAHLELGHAGAMKTYQHLLKRFTWTKMHKSVHDYYGTCCQCQYVGDKRPAAPVTGHVTAEEPAEKVQIDIIHMKLEEGHKYILTLCDVYSRWGMAIPLTNIKAETVAKALKRQAIPNGLGRPVYFLVDGGSEFKAEVVAACTAWGTKWRTHMPHHSQSAGIIEKFNKTLEVRITHFVNQCDCNWMDALPLALESYNGAVHAALSQGTIGISPAEVWLGRRLRFNSDVLPTVVDNPKSVEQYLEWARQQTQQVKDWISAARLRYEEQIKKVKSGRNLRHLAVGDKVVLSRPTDKRDKNSGTLQWDGPWEVVELGEYSTDYRIKRLGTRRQPKWAHIDDLGLIHLAAAPAVASQEPEKIEEAAKSAKNWEVQRIEGERGTTRSTKQYLVKFQGYDDSHWRPAADLQCPELVQKWNILSPEQRKALTEGAQVAEVNVIRDLRAHLQEQPADIIRSICREIGITLDQVRAVLASPCCNTFTKVDAINMEKGHHFREPVIPYRPREFDGTQESLDKGLMAREHDYMVQNLLASLLKDKAEGAEYDFVMENPMGRLRHRPYMMQDSWLHASTRTTVDYCAFNHAFQKSTDLWHSFKEWKPQGTTGDGRCHGQCGAGRIKSNGRFAHWKKHAGKAGEGVQGKGSKHKKWMIPFDLTAEVVAQLKVADNKQKYVIDLFSGGESYRAAVEAAGYIYVPVDIHAFKGAEEAAETTEVCMCCAGDA